MSVYKYNGTSVIDEVTIRKVANGSVRAYLHGREGLDMATVQSIKDKIEEAGFEWLSFTLDGKPVLEVRGFEKRNVFTNLISSEKQELPLLNFLSQNKFIQGKPTKSEEPGDRIGWKELFKKNTLFLSGLAMATADIGFSIYGFKEAKIHKMVNPHHQRDFSEMLAGFSYLGGSTMLSLYGRNDQSDLQVREMAGMILEKAQERGMVMDDSAAASLGKERKEGVFTKVDNFFRKHPAEVGNMMYFTAGTLIAQSALRNRALAKPRPDMTAQQISEMRKGGWGDTALGTTTMASGLFATFGKEKVADPDAPKKHGLGAVVDWIQSNPLAVASYGYIGSTLCHAYTTYVERKEAIRASKDLKLSASERLIAGEKVKAVPWRVLFIGATLVGEFLLSISSKGHGQGVVSDNSVNDSSVAIAADLILRQPKPMQEELIKYLGNFLGQPDVLAIGDEDAIKLLRQQVETMRNNPWAMSASSSSKNKRQSILASPQADAWRAKLASQQAGEPSLNLPA